MCFLEKYIDGCAFMMLNEDDVRELVPPIGLTKKIVSFVPKVSCSGITSRSRGACLPLARISFSVEFPPLSQYITSQPFFYHKSPGRIL